MSGAALRAILAVAAVLTLSLASARTAPAVTIVSVKSAGGIEAWLVEDHSLPLVALRFSFENGAALDPPGKEGLANFAASLLDEGAGDLDSEAYKARLEDLSIRLEFSAGMDFTGGTMRTLSRNTDAAFDLVRLSLTRPRFDPEAVGRVREQLVAQLQEATHEPPTIGGRLFWRTAFPEHPYGRRSRGTVASLGRIEAADLRRFAAERFGRDRLRIGVVGDVTPERLRALLDRTFGDLPARSAPGTVEEIAAIEEGALLLVKVPVPQSAVVFGEQGLKRDDPDWYAAVLLNEILGGSGVTSRLTAEVRDKRGLAYSIYSELDPMRHAGMIVGRVATRNDRVAETVDLVREEWRRMRDDGPTEAELATAKTYTIGSFAPSLDSSNRLAGLLVAMQTENLGIDYLARRAALFEKVGLEDVRRVARRLLDPRRLRIVVVGNPASLPGAREMPSDGG